MASVGRGARIKGANFERAVAKKLTEDTGCEWIRGLGQTRGGGTEVSDVKCDDLSQIHVEVKCQKRVSIKGALKQAISDIGDTGKIPVVITKDDRQPVLVTMRYDEWIEFFKTWIESE